MTTKTTTKHLFRFFIQLTKTASAVQSHCLLSAAAQAQPERKGTDWKHGMVSGGIQSRRLHEAAAQMLFSGFQKFKDEVFFQKL